MSYQSRHPDSTYVPGLDDGYYIPQPTPELISPEPQRIQPEMSNHIADGIEAVQKLNLDSTSSRRTYGDMRKDDTPHLSPFPKLVNPPPNVPPSDEELEATLENARTLVLNSNDPEMQLAWAADALVFVGVCEDNEERGAAAKPHTARPSTPRIEHQLKIDAMGIVNFLADQNHPKAEFLKGMWLEWGRYGQREDKKEAFRCYSRAADRGYSRAEYRIGMLYESYNDPVKALRHYNRGVDAGDAASCYRLGMMTFRGQCGQVQDYNKAIDLIRKSADAADENAAQGAYVYGMLLCNGLPQLSLPKGCLQLDDRQARMNIEKAAYLKFAKAQLKMGSAYELGSLGCDFNPALSVHYNALASKQGEAEADMALSKWFLVGSDGLFPKNEELAYNYAERAAHGGLATGEFALGYFHEIGMHVPVSLTKAMDWYKLASTHGNEDAQGRIEALEKRQVLSKKDHENVAVSRIKSQYGSMRGGRPERFRQQPSAMQNMSIPENRTSSIQPPQRGTTPYPEHDTPFPQGASIQRPATVTPYPMEDGPPKNQSSRLTSDGYYNSQPPSRPATTLNPEIRPSSAFQINPSLQSEPSVASQHSTRPSYASGAPVSTRPPPSQSYGGRATGPGLRPDHGIRVSSGPQRPPKNPINAFPPQATQRPPTAPPAAPQQQYDIGYTAPPDDRRSRIASANRIPTNGSGPMPSKAPADTTRPTNGRTSAVPPPAGRMSTPVGGPGRPSVDGRTSKPQKAGTAPSGSANLRPDAAIGAGAIPRPPKAAKTFDEMGVPASRHESECVIM